MGQDGYALLHNAEGEPCGFFEDLESAELAAAQADPDIAGQFTVTRMSRARYQQELDDWKDWVEQGGRI